MYNDIRTSCSDEKNKKRNTPSILTVYAMFLFLPALRMQNPIS